MRVSTHEIWAKREQNDETCAKEKNKLSGYKEAMKNRKKLLHADSWKAREKSI